MWLCQGNLSGAVSCHSFQLDCFSWVPWLVDASTFHLIKCNNITFLSVTKNNALQRSCCVLFSRGKFLCTCTRAELQRDIVHLSQISCLCNCLSTLRPSSGGKNTLSCGCEITGIYVVVYHWACQRTKQLGFFPAWSHNGDLVQSKTLNRDKPSWFSDQHSQTDMYYMIPFDAQRVPSMQQTQRERAPNCKCWDQTLGAHKGCLTKMGLNKALRN